MLWTYLGHFIVDTRLRVDRGDDVKEDEEGEGEKEVFQGY